MTVSAQQGQEIVNALIARCWEDESFKKELLSAPAEAIEKFTGKSFKVPAGMKLLVTDQTSTDYLHINIPAKPDMDNVELTEEQLEAVAGGITPTIVAYLTVLSVGIMIGQCLN